MSISARVLGVVGMLVLVGSVVASREAAGGATSQQAGMPRVVESRTIEVPGTEIISLSPDGRRLAALKPENADREGHLCVYDVATLAEEGCGDLSLMDAGLNPTDVVWSPDGSRIAFAENAFQLLREGDLWVMDAATGQLTNLTDDGATRRLPISRPPDVSELFVDVSPAWTPDGRAIAVSRSTWRDGDWQGNELALVDVETGRVESLYQVTREAIGVVIGPMAWSADGSKLYYSVLPYEGNDPARGMWVLDRESRQADLIVATGTNATDYPFRAVSPRGDRLLTASAGAASQFDLPEAFYDLVDLAGPSVTPLTVPDAGGADVARIRLAAFSPDGSMLVLVVSSPAAQFTQVIVREIDGGAETVLATDLPYYVGGFVGQTVQWAADGTLYVPSAEPGLGTLLRLDTGTATPVASA